MIKLFLLLLLPFSLFASKILSYNIYERSDRADIMITFDTPYHGAIKQSKGTNSVIIKLNNAAIESSKIKKVNSDFLHSITITPMKNQTQILAKISPNVRLIASKTADAYGLRLRFTKKASPKKSQASDNTTDLSNLPTKKGVEISTSYYLVVGFLIVAIIVLMLVKKKMITPNVKAQKSPWLFNETAKTQTPATTVTQNTVTSQEENVSIRFQKSLNETNSVVMLDFRNASYLVMMGNSNIVLDKFLDNQPQTQQEFESILQDKNHILEDFLGSNDVMEMNQPNRLHNEPLQAYKERAASLYSDEV